MASKLVEFENWCPACVHVKVKQEDDPCHSCLTNTTNQDSHRPVKFVQDPKKKPPVEKKVRK